MSAMGRPGLLRAPEIRIGVLALPSGCRAPGQAGAARCLAWWRWLRGVGGRCRCAERRAGGGAALHGAGAPRSLTTLRALRRLRTTIEQVARPSLPFSPFLTSRHRSASCSACQALRQQPPALAGGPADSPPPPDSCRWLSQAAAAGPACCPALEACRPDELSSQPADRSGSTHADLAGLHVVTSAEQAATGASSGHMEARHRAAAH